MNFIPAVCPQCSGNLQLPDDRESVKCMYCGVEVIIRETTKSSKEAVQTYLSLANTSEASQNYSEAFSYYTKALEIDPKCTDAWIGKGKSAGWQSNLLQSRIAETTKCFKKAIECENSEEMKVVVRMQCALNSVFLAQAFFNTSLNHTIQFISVLSAQYEHISRCVEVVKQCEFAISIDPDVVGAADLIGDISRRMLQVGRCTKDEEIFFTAAMRKYSSIQIKSAKLVERDSEINRILANKKTDRTVAGSRNNKSQGIKIFLAFTPLFAWFGVYVASFLAVKYIFGVESTAVAVVLSIVLGAIILRVFFAFTKKPDVS